MGKGMEIAVVYRDEDVAIRVREFLQREHFPTLHWLDVDVVNGELTLRGEVVSFYEKQIAMSISQRTPGVQVFVDKISVSSS